MIILSLHEPRWSNLPALRHAICRCPASSLRRPKKLYYVWGAEASSDDGGVSCVTMGHQYMVVDRKMHGCTPFCLHPARSPSRRGRKWGEERSIWSCWSFSCIPKADVWLHGELLVANLELSVQEHPLCFYPEPLTRSFNLNLPG